MKRILIGLCLTCCVYGAGFNSPFTQQVLLDPDFTTWLSTNVVMGSTNLDVSSVFSADFSQMTNTAEPTLPDPQIGTWSATKGYAFAARTEGFVTNGFFVTSGRQANGSIYYLMTKPVTPVNVMKAKWKWTGPVGSLNDKALFTMFSFTNTTTPDIFVHLRIYRIGAFLDTYRLSDGFIPRGGVYFDRLAINTVHSAQLSWLPNNIVAVEINGREVMRLSNPNFGVAPTEFTWEQYYDPGAATADTDAVALSSAELFNSVLLNPINIVGGTLITPTIKGSTILGGSLVNMSSQGMVNYGSYLEGATNYLGTYWGGNTSGLTNYNPNNQYQYSYGGQFDSPTNNGPVINIPIFKAIPTYADNAAALAGGLVVGNIYRNGDILQVVH